MFDKLVDVLLQFVRLFQFFTVVMTYERGVVLRFGHFTRIAEPGFHFIWPFNIEVVLRSNVVPETMNVGPQSLTTKDDKSVIVSTIVTFAVADVVKFLLEIEGANQVVEDCTYGIVAKFVMERTWVEVRKDDISAELTRAVRQQAKKYGVRIVNVQISDLTASRTLRLMSQRADVSKGAMWT